MSLDCFHFFEETINSDELLNGYSIKAPMMGLKVIFNMLLPEMLGRLGNVYKKRTHSVCWQVERG